jgi:hypothetical protein
MGGVLRPKAVRVTLGCSTVAGIPPVVDTVLPVIGGVTVIVGSSSIVGLRGQGGRPRERLLRRLCARSH